MKYLPGVCTALIDLIHSPPPPFNLLFLFSFQSFHLYFSQKLSPPSFPLMPHLTSFPSFLLTFSHNFSSAVWADWIDCYIWAFYWNTYFLQWSCPRSPPTSVFDGNGPIKLLPLSRFTKWDGKLPQKGRTLLSKTLNWRVLYLSRVSCLTDSSMDITIYFTLIMITIIAT